MGDSNGADCGHGAHYIGVKILLRYYYKAIFYIMNMHQSRIFTHDSELTMVHQVYPGVPAGFIQVS